MINTVIFDDEIKVWWDYVKLGRKESFCIYLDGKQIGKTEKSHFNIKGLNAQTEYDLKVERVCANEKVKDCIGTATVITAEDKIRIDVTKPPYNAKGDGKTLDTKAIQSAINDCDKIKCVYFPDGIYMTGALDLKSDVEIRLEENAVIQGTDNEKDYLPKIKTRFEGREEICYRSLFNAGKIDSKGGINCENIVIRGGKILGGGNNLRLSIINAEKQRVLKEHGLENEVNPPAFYSSVLPGRARGRLFGFNNVGNVIIANGEYGDAPSWNMHFTYCENIITCGCKIVSHKISNGDGWDPDSSKNCIIFDVCFDTGDDCVAIKSGKNLEGYKINRPSEHVRVFDIDMEDGHGIAIGSEMSGGISDVKIWNCNLPGGTGIYFKSSKVRGGYIKDVKVFNCFAPTLSVLSGYGINNDGEPAPVEPKISDLFFEDITLTGIGKFTGNHDRIEPETSLNIHGLSENNPIKNVHIKNLTLKYRQMIPNQIVKFNNVENLTLEDVVCLGEI